MTSVIDITASAPVRGRQPANAAEGPPGARSALVDAHLDVAAIVAEFDLGDATLWAEVAAIVSDVVTEANDTAAALTGAPPSTTATEVPPIVRVRELAVAQRRLFGALDSRTSADHPQALRKSADRVQGLGQWLEHLARRS